MEDQSLANNKESVVDQDLVKVEDVNDPGESSNKLGSVLKKYK